MSTSDHRDVEGDAEQRTGTGQSQDWDPAEGERDAGTSVGDSGASTAERDAGASVDDAGDIEGDAEQRTGTGQSEDWDPGTA